MKQTFLLLKTFASFVAMLMLNFSLYGQCIPDQAISLYDGSMSAQICGDQDRLTVIPGSNASVYAFAITAADGTIEAVNLKRIVSFAGLEPGPKRIYGVSWFGVLHRPIGQNIADAVFSDFCYELSTNFIEVDLGAGSMGTLEAANDIACLNDGVASLVANAVNTQAADGYEVIYVLTQGDGLVIQGVNDSPEFEVQEAGSYTIHTLIYDPATLDLGIVEIGTTTGFDVNGLLVQGGGDVCAILDVAGAKFTVVNPQVGAISPVESNVCLSDGGNMIAAQVDVDAIVPDGYSLLYVLTKGEELTIEQVNTEPNFMVSENGTYTIHTLVYDAANLDLGIVEFGVTTGVDVNGLLVQGGGSICASLDVAGAKISVDEPSAGSLVASMGEINCSSEQITLIAEIEEAPLVPANYEVIYVLTSGEDLVIQGVNAEPSFEVSEDGLFTIHTLVYNPSALDLSIVEPGVTTGFDVNSLLVQGGGAICASLDVVGAQYTVATPQAGTLTAKESNACLVGDDAVLIEAETDEMPIVPAGYSLLYVLTSGEELVIRNVSDEAFFEVEEGGIYTIHTLVYDPSTLDLGIVELGTTTGVDVNGLLVQGGGSICASLDVAGAKFTIAAPDAGTLVGGESVTCEEGGVVLEATAEEMPNVPAGYEVIYVLTSGKGLVIQAVNSEPSFEVESPGFYTIHTLVYDPETLDLGVVAIGETTGFDVNSLLVQGGGAICASLDVPGASYEVGPYAGTLSVASAGCLLSSGISLVASSNEDAVIPDGFELLYVLTSGEALVIEQVSALPEFFVEEEGVYTIHSLVYDPSTLDLSIVQPGVTTGVDVNGLLVQGGGAICGSLDVAGARFNVASPQAGTLTSVTADFCYADQPVTIEAAEDQAPTIPDGFSQIYVLTSGDDLVIQGVADLPSFEVSQTGIFTIHSLVYNAETLDLGIVEFGVTTGFDVNALLAQGGGSICASLDVAGAKFGIGPDAGTLAAIGSTGCEGNFTLEAEVDEAAYIPAGYTLLYVLTSGTDLVIQQVGSTPQFTVENEGLFTIHSLVYDANTLDLSIVVPGVTTGVDVNGLLVQGGGSICAALDVAGAPFMVQAPSAGTLTSVDANVCYTGSLSTITATPDGNDFIPMGFSKIFVLTSGDDLVIEAVNSEPAFEVTDAGIYTIHTLIYDPSTLDLGIVQIGVTTGVDVNGLLVQGGGSICASLDVAGAKFEVGPSAGTLLAVDPHQILPAAGSVTLSANREIEPFIPAGYDLIYVLTSGDDLVIEGVNATSSFEVNEAGKYTIHTLVYDATTLDLGIVEVGVTTGVDVNGLLVQGGGDVCAALDVAGAGFDVVVAAADVALGENLQVNLDIRKVWFDNELVKAEISSGSNTMVTMQVVHLSGLVLFQGDLPLNKGRNDIQIPLALENPSSIYFVKLHDKVFKISKNW